MSRTNRATRAIDACYEAAEDDMTDREAEFLDSLDRWVAKGRSLTKAQDEKLMRLCKKFEVAYKRSYSD